MTVTDGEFDRNLAVYTGADNDILEMRRNDVSGDAVLGGASGLDDVFQYDGLNAFYRHVEIRGFEHYNPISKDTDFCNIHSCTN